MPNPKLAILIVNYESASFLESCLHSVEKALKDYPKEICVIDNGSKEECGAMIHQKFPHAMFIRNPVNQGFAHAVNQGLQATKAPYVLWLNPDAEWLDGNIEQVLSDMEKDASIGIAGLRIENPDGSRQLSCRSFPSYTTAFFHRYSLMTRWFPGNPFSRCYLHNDFDAGAVQEVDWVSGACLLHKRELVQAIGPVDERFFMYAEDVDFCLRAKKAGHKVIYHPGVRVLHHIAASSRRAFFKMILVRHESMWKYYAKHFRRNIFKDAVVGAAIGGRCLLKLAAGWAGCLKTKACR